MFFSLYTLQVLLNKNNAFSGYIETCEFFNPISSQPVTSNVTECYLGLYASFPNILFRLPVFEIN